MFSKNYKQCSEKTKKGERCKKNKIESSKYCEIHNIHYERQNKNIRFLILQAMLGVFSFLLINILNHKVFPEIIVNSSKVEILIYILVVLAFLYLLAIVTIGDITSWILHVKNAGYFVFPIFVFSLTKILHSETFTTDIIINIILYVLLIIGSGIILILVANKKKIQFNLKISLLLVFGIIMLSIGVFIINGISFLEKHELEINLNYCNDTSIRYSENLICDKPIYVNKLITCDSLDKSNQNITGKFTFTLENGTIKESGFENKIEFLTIEHVNSLKLELNFINNDTLVCLSSQINNIRFPTYEEYKNNKQTFANYFFGLLALIFISLPLIVKKYEDMYKNNDL